MKVETLAAYDTPEQIACTAARGDYYDGFVADVDYDEVMEPVGYEENDVESVHEIAQTITGEGSFIDMGTRSVPARSVVASAEYEHMIDPETLYRQYHLLEELFGDGHWGVWEHPQITLAIEGVSRACMAQLTRHRHVSFDVQSQRYVDFSLKDDPVRTPLTAREGQSQNREDGLTTIDEETQQKISSLYEAETESAFEAYEILIENGMPKEEARMVLPIGTKVNMTASMNARTLLHVANLREKANAQSEIRNLTDLILDEFDEWMPMTNHIFEKKKPLHISP